MSLRRADARFLLPTSVETAAVVEPLAGWRTALEAAGVEILDRSPRHVPDLAVAPAGEVSSALATGAELVILEGRGGRRQLIAAGFGTTRYLGRPVLDSPEFFLPLDEPAPAAYALRHWTTEDRRWRAARNAVLASVAARGRLPAIVPGLTIGARSPGVPHVVAAARDRVPGLGADGWLLSLGRADALSRNVFHLFAASEREPSAVVKFTRMPGYEEPFIRDERGLRLAADAGPPVSDHAPRLVARFDVDGAFASVETAAPGEPLKRFLNRPIPRKAKLAALSAVAAWIVEVGRATRRPSDDPVALRAALGETEASFSDGRLDDVVAATSDVPAVLAHNDLGSWNVIRSADGGFVATDWESARSDGFPVWDLVYFLTEALATADGALEGRWEPYVRALFRGTGESSRFLFEWLARAVSAAALPPERVGPLVTLCWLHHSASTARRRDAVERHGSGAPAAIPPLERVAATWLSDPELGPGWQVWRTVT